MCERPHFNYYQSESSWKLRSTWGAEGKPTVAASAQPQSRSLRKAQLTQSSMSPKCSRWEPLQVFRGLKKKKKAQWDVDGDGVAPTDQFGENYLILSGTSGKEPAHQCRRCKGLGFDPWGRKIPWRRAWQPTPAFLPGESPWTEEPGGLQSIGLQRVRHIWSDLASTPSIFSNIEASNPSTWDVSPCI